MTIHKKKVEAVFVTTWDEAIALEHEFRLLRQVAKERFEVDNVQMKRWYPWRGPNHTEFSLIVERTSSASVAKVKRWLQRVVKDFLKQYNRNPRMRQHGRPRGKPQVTETKPCLSTKRTGRASLTAPE